MSREIKYRVWTGKEMVSLCDDNSRNYLIIGLTWAAYNRAGEVICNSWDKSAKLLQFTGLKDKKGKDIYEGDIVSTITHVHQNKFIDFISFRHGQFMLDGIEYSLWDSYESCKIIGNIFENPELLK